MKMPLIAGLAPPVVGPLRPTLAVGQVLPVRLVTPEDAQELVAISKTLVVETTLGIARLRPLPAEIAARPPSPLPPPSPGAMAETAKTAAQVPAAQLFLEVLSLAPLKVRLIAQDGRERGPALPHPDTAEAELELEWLSPRTPAGSKAGSRLPESRAAPGPEELTGPKPGTKPEPGPAQARKALSAAIHQVLRQILPRQGELREEWTSLLKLEHALLHGRVPAGQAASAPNLLEQALGRVAAQLLRQTLAELPDAKALRVPGQGFPVPAPPEAESRSGDSARNPKLAVPGEARPPGAASATAASTPPWRALRALLSGSEPRTVQTEALPLPAETSEANAPVRLAPKLPNWTEAARAMQALVRLANLPSSHLPQSQPTQGAAGVPEPYSVSTAPEIAVPASPTAEAPSQPADAEGSSLRFLRQLLSSSAGPKLAPQDVLPSGARPAAAAPEMPVFAELMHSLDKLAARSQGQQLGQLNQSLQTPGVFSWEIPVRDGARLDLLSLRVEERDAGEASGQPAGRSYWSCQLQFDFPELGPIRAVVQWRDRRIDTRFFAESPGTVVLLNQELGWLNAALTAAGVAAEVHPCQQTPLAKPRSPPDLGRFDVSV
ncbi:MAG: flagellar hook-length control protein FliK [Gammaproteobacteria bacterium]|nr:flagellar hook-length control protein FliK [Gammaproteobacteria bacterium]